jgi:hypothetical protein
MFDVESVLEVPAAYMFDVRLILACHRASLPASENYVLCAAFEAGRSAIECASSLLDSEPKWERLPEFP